MRPFFIRRWLPLLLAVALAGGCKPPHEEKPPFEGPSGRLSGTITTADGTAVPLGQLVAVDNDGRTAATSIHDGQYSFKFAPAGEVRLYLDHRSSPLKRRPKRPAVDEDITEKDPDLAKKQAEQAKKLEEIEQQKLAEMPEQMQAAIRAYRQIPEAYLSKKESPLSTTVRESTDNHYNIQLKDKVETKSQP